MTGVKKCEKTKKKNDKEENGIGTIRKEGLPTHIIQFELKDGVGKFESRKQMVQDVELQAQLARLLLQCRGADLMESKCGINLSLYHCGHVFLLKQALVHLCFEKLGLRLSCGDKALDLDPVCFEISSTRVLGLLNGAGQIHDLVFEEAILLVSVLHDNVAEAQLRKAKVHHGHSQHGRGYEGCSGSAVHPVSQDVCSLVAGCV